MTMDEDHNGQPPGPMADKGIDDAIAHVLEEQAEKAKNRDEAPVPREGGSSPLVWGAFVVFTALSAYVWFAPPAWLDVPVSEPMSSELAEAGIRMEVYLQAVNVQEFLESERRLPNSLEELGDPFTLVVYERLDADRYRLSMDGPDGVVMYQSTDSLDGLMGDAMQTIREGR